VFAARTPENRIPIRLLQAIDVCYARIYHQVIITKPCRVPRYGPGIVVSNHISSLDPLLIQSVCPRLITWMMAKEYFGNPILDWVFNTVGVIPVERSGKDLASTRAAMRALADGRVLGIFPEGRISETPQLLKFHTGAAMMALKTQSPVYPVYIHGTQMGQGMLQALLHRNRCELIFGAPISFAPDETAQAATERIRQAIEALRCEARYGIVEKNSRIPPFAPGYPQGTIRTEYAEKLKKQ